MQKNGIYTKGLFHILVVLLLLIPLFVDTPEGKLEFMWLFYLLPPLLSTYYYGSKGGVLMGIFCVLVISSFELYEFMVYAEYNLQNLLVVLGIVGGIIAETLWLGSLLRHLENKQQELEHLSQQLAFWANHDALTALPNRRLFEQRLSEASLNAKDLNQTIALIFCDLDRFKNLNDTAGHCAGDLVITEVAQRVKESIRTCDFISRLGGDEFIILLNDVSSVDEVASVAQRIISTIELPITLNTIEHKISASLGIALYPKDSTDPSTLLQYADIAMYQSKARGNGNYTFFTPEMGKALLQQTRLESSLKNALDRREFTLHYQPLCDIETGRVISVEALIRWNHPEMGLISPDEFIPVAEETGLIVPIGEWVLRTALREAKRWHDAGHMIKISVNISSLQLERDSFIPLVKEVLSEAGLNPQFLELEITERVALSNPEEMIQKLNLLRSIGVQIVIDDFGTGYSSLSYLKKYPVHSIKIDRSFIQDIAFEARDRAMLKALLIMAKSLNFSTVAEGVETPEQLSILAESGCNVAQGYFLSRPIPPEDFFDYLMSKRTEENDRHSSLA